MMLTVQKVTPNDNTIINAIIEIIIEGNDEKLSAEYLTTVLSDSHTYLYASMLDNEVIGYILAYKFPSVYSAGYLAYLYDIEVDAQHRRKGAGRLLIHQLITDLKLANVKELWLGTATDNVEAQALFKSTGGIKSGETFNDFTYELG